MKTKIVYVLISSQADVYTEQTWVSAWSLKHYNPESHVTLVADEETLEGLKTCYRQDFLKFVDEEIAIHFDSSISNIERSRILKTSLREIVKGDFLFVDSDTIITDSLFEIDKMPCHIGMVYDLHNKLSEYPFEKILKDWHRDLFGVDLSDDTDQFNSGVIYAKDDIVAHDFFKRWHDNWANTKIKTGYRDQPSLRLTCNEIPGVVEPISGVWNCQVMVSIAYIHKAKIMHFFNTQWKKTSISPFFGKGFYMQVKCNNGLTEEMKSMILNCKSEFSTPSMPVMISEVQLGRTPLYNYLLYLFEERREIFNRIERLVMSMLRKKRRLSSLFKRKNSKKDQI